MLGKLKYLTYKKIEHLGLKNVRLYYNRVNILILAKVYELTPVQLIKLSDKIPFIEEVDLNGLSNGEKYYPISSDLIKNKKITITYKLPNNGELFTYDSKLMEIYNWDFIVDAMYENREYLSLINREAKIGYYNIKNNEFIISNKGLLRTHKKFYKFKSEKYDIGISCLNVKASLTY